LIVADIPACREAPGYPYRLAEILSIRPRNPFFPSPPQGFGHYQGEYGLAAAVHTPCAGQSGSPSPARQTRKEMAEGKPISVDIERL